MASSAAAMPRSLQRIPKTILSPCRKQNGEQVTYDPSRLRGITAYREIEREFAIGDKIQFTAPQRDLQVANRDLGTIQQIGRAMAKSAFAWMAGKDRIVRFDPSQMRHFDHGYAVTSHSSQGLTVRACLGEYGYRMFTRNSLTADLLMFPFRGPRTTRRFSPTMRQRSPRVSAAMYPRRPRLTSATPKVRLRILAWSRPRP